MVSFESACCHQTSVSCNVFRHAETKQSTQQHITIKIITDVLIISAIVSDDDNIVVICIKGDVS